MTAMPKNRNLQESTQRKKKMGLPDLSGKIRRPCYDAKGYPKCWGTFKKNDDCDCPHWRACMIYTYEEMAEKADDVRRSYYQEVPLDERRDVPQHAALDRADYFTTIQREAETLTVRGGDINLDLICYMVFFALEQPATARAFITRLRPGVRNLQDIAEMLGVSRQAVQKRVAQELGIGKRNYRIDDFTQLSEREFMVYKLCFQDGCSMRSAAAEIGIDHKTVKAIIERLKAKGFDFSEKNEKNN